MIYAIKSIVKIITDAMRNLNPYGSHTIFINLVRWIILICLFITKILNGYVQDVSNDDADLLFSDLILQRAQNSFEPP